jgi:predicted small metal-binding protein
MAEELKSISCEPKCGFMVRSSDENELIETIKTHVKKKHPGLEMSDQDIKGMIKPA